MFINKTQHHFFISETQMTTNVLINLLAISFPWNAAAANSRQSLFDAIDHCEVSLLDKVNGNLYTSPNCRAYSYRVKTATDPYIQFGRNDAEINLRECPLEHLQERLDLCLTTDQQVAAIFSEMQQSGCSDTSGSTPTNPDTGRTSSIFSSPADCFAVVRGDSNFCAAGDRATNDCFAIVRGDDTYCESTVHEGNDCFAIVRNDAAYCSSQDCAAVVRGNSSACTTDVCRAIVRQDSNLCGYQ